MTNDGLDRPSQCMSWSLPIRCVWALIPLLGGVAGAASLRVQAGPAGQTRPAEPGKPSAAVSTLPAAQATGESPGGSGKTEATAEPAPHRIAVGYDGGKLSVVATNGSLNEILREIEEKTGIKITGGVADERVFGSYGPAPAAAVLAELLEGTGSNMLLVDDAGGRSELILTARNGGPTPPNPNAGQSYGNDEPDTGAGRYVPPIRPYGPPGSTGRGLPGAASGLPPAGGGGEQGAPTPPPTPQQIYDQLQKSQQNQPPPPQ